MGSCPDSTVPVNDSAIVVALNVGDARGEFRKSNGLTPSVDAMTAATVPETGTVVGMFAAAMIERVRGISRPRMSTDRHAHRIGINASEPTSTAHTMAMGVDGRGVVVLGVDAGFPDPPCVVTGVSAVYAVMAAGASTAASDGTSGAGLMDAGAITPSSRACPTLSNTSRRESHSSDNALSSAAYCGARRM